MTPRVAKKRSKPLTKSTLKRVWKESEQDCAKFALDHDKPHPAMRSAMSPKGRVGHLNIPGLDVITEHFVWENKKKETPPPGWLLEPLHKVIERCQEWRTMGIIRVDFQGQLPDKLPKGCKPLGLKRMPPIYIVVEPHFSKLLTELRYLDALERLKCSRRLPALQDK